MPVFAHPVCRLGTAIAILALAIPASPATAQLPEKFTNLQVLPEDIAQRQLINIMRGFTAALGVRCQSCHVGEKVDTLEDFDFAADDKEAKRIARGMMEMVADVNGRLPAATGRDQPASVTCFTCHHGIQKPVPLETVLLDALEEGGVAATIARYRELRDEYYGSAAYDFGGQALNRVAETLYRGQEDLEDALTILRLNLEFDPTNTYSLLLLAQGQVRQGDREAAIATLEKALEIEPDSQYLKNSLEQLRAAGE